MKQKRKIHFGKLLGNEYCIVEKMHLLDWMLKTGKPYRERVGRWHVAGISQLLLDYSANDYDCQFNLLDYKFNWFFDAVFARAVYKPAGETALKWRNAERIFPDRFRFFEIDYSISKEARNKPYYFHNTLSMIWALERYREKILKKYLHHPDYENRTFPKIIDIKLYTIGQAWVVDYCFSFSEYDYEPGWTKSFGQNPDESINEFLFRVIKELDSRVTEPIFKSKP